MAIQFRCYRCQSLLQIESASPGQLIQCGKCRHLLQLQPPTKDAPLSKDRLQIWRTLPTTPDPSQVQATRESSQYWQDVARETKNAQSARSSSSAPRTNPFEDLSNMSREDSPLVVVPASYLDKPKRRNKKGRTSSVLQGLMVLIGIGVVCFAVLAVVIAIKYNPYTRSTELKTQGYAVTAPGDRVANISGVSSKSELSQNPITKSVYEMGFVYLEGINIEAYIAGLRKLGAKEIYPVERVNLVGYHYELEADTTTPKHEAEIFPVNGGLLIVAYMNGADRAAAQGTTHTMSADECRANDRVQDYFHSLRRLSE